VLLLLTKPVSLGFLVLYPLFLELLELLAITCVLHIPWRLEYSSTVILLRLVK
jgi:hypothetical protein